MVRKSRSGRNGRSMDLSTLFTVSLSPGTVARPEGKARLPREKLFEQVLRGLEAHAAARGDADLLPGLRVAPGARLARLHAEGPEVRDHDLLAAAQRRAHGFERRLDR